ncbi:hypothetical protein FRB90_007352, partial [Tulasnella sp. 427]
PLDSKGLPKFVWRNITFGDWKDERAEEFVVDVPQSVQRNGSMWLHTYLTTHRVETGLDGLDEGFNPDTLYHFRKPLTRYLKKPKVVVEKNLLSGEDDAEFQRRQAEAEAEADVWLSYWHPNVTLTLVSDPPIMPSNGISVPTVRYFTPHPGKRDATGKTGFYYPVIFPNDFWLLRGHMSPVNATTPTLPLRITYHPISTLKFNLFASFSQGFDEAANKGGGAASADLDEIKRTLIETNPWLLITTAVVSILHMLFEMLAFSSDIAHWRKKDELVGVSVRSILVSVFVQIITGLYLWDNSEETSWMVLLTQTMGVAIEAWKVQLVPQLIINYKLKSVAHMPWKAMVYKTLSTVVDDFFAFIIKMPWLHRLACFRDDVVFLILLYQRWIYRIDYSRANEYGQKADAPEEETSEKTVEGVDKRE